MEAQRTRVALRQRAGLLEPAPASGVNGGAFRFQSLSAIATGRASPRTDSPPPQPGLIHTGSGFSFESSVPSTPITPTTPTTPTTPLTPITPTRIDSNASSLVRTGRHLNAVKIDWAATRKVLGETGASSLITA